MRAYSREVTTRVNFVEIDGKEFRLNDVLEIAEELAEADGFCYNLVIYDSNISKMLEEQGVASRNARGSYGRGPNYEEFLNELYNLKVYY